METVFGNHASPYPNQNWGFSMSQAFLPLFWSHQLWGPSSIIYSLSTFNRILKSFGRYKRKHFVHIWYSFVARVVQKSHNPNILLSFWEQTLFFIVWSWCQGTLFLLMDHIEYQYLLLKKSIEVPLRSEAEILKMGQIYEKITQFLT